MQCRRSGLFILAKASALRACSAAAAERVRRRTHGCGLRGSHPSPHPSYLADVSIFARLGPISLTRRAVNNSNPAMQSERGVW